jgi:hypothetical protein
MGAVVLVIFLVLIVLFSAVGYGGLGYYDNNNNRDPMPYNSNMWWCHYCSGRSCPSMCWS